jgi:hypothetical protein
MQMPDTVSAVCGLADGFSKCGLGPRVITFTDKITGQPVAFPYNGFTWNAVTSVLTRDPAQAAAGTCVLTATVTLVNYPTVFYSQDITSTNTVTKQIFIASQTLTATIGQDAILLLPNIGVEYIVLSSTKFLASVNGYQLTVKSISNSDVGTFLL